VINCGTVWPVLLRSLRGLPCRVAGKVRNGFGPYTRRAVASRFTGLKTDTWPFANLPEKKRTQWALTKEEK
jgi:hypothetical protein